MLPFLGADRVQTHWPLGVDKHLHLALTLKLRVRCFHLQSRLFLYFHLLQLFSLSFFYSFTGMAFLRSTSLLRATIECSIAEATHHGTLIPHQFGSLFLRMQNDASRVSLEFCTEERQQSIASRHLQVVFHYLDEGRHTSFRQKVKRLHSCDH